jgi:hypothetical protein
MAAEPAPAPCRWLLCCDREPGGTIDYCVIGVPAAQWAEQYARLDSVWDHVWEYATERKAGWVSFRGSCEPSRLGRYYKGIRGAMGTPAPPDGRTPMRDTEIVQLKVYVPAEVRRMAKMEAARRDLTTSRFISAVVREVAAKAAAAERGE